MHNIQLSASKNNVDVSNSSIPFFGLTSMANLLVRNSRIVILNQAAVSLLGANSVEQYIDKPVFDLFHSDHHTILQECISIVESSHSGSINRQVFRLKQSLQKIEVSSIPVHDKNGHAILLILQKPTFYESQSPPLKIENLYQLFECYPTMMMLINPHTGLIAYANQACTKFFDLKKELLQQMKIHDLCQMNCQDLNEKLLGSALGLNKKFTIQGKLPVDKFYILDFYTSSISIENKIFLFNIIFDITESHKNENRLHHRIEELTISNKELESYSYSVSHDLRGPLNAIIGFNNFLIEDYYDKLDESGKRYLLRIKASANRMNELIDCMLNLSKISMQEIVIQDVNMSTIAENFLNELQMTQSPRSITIKIEPNMITKGDRSLLELAITNLLRNSWKFTCKKDSAIIEFASFNRDGKVVYYLKDNGAGFNMRYMDSLFKPFQRLHSDEDFKGSGIGLATVARVINRHGGKIWAEGEVNKGATFFFMLQK